MPNLTRRKVTKQISPRAVACTIALTCIVIFGAVVRYDFVSWDDNFNIVNHTLPSVSHTRLWDKWPRAMHSIAEA